ncbi:hypothetical protein [Haloferula sp. BvORR071]|uniref:hypothetical protein n=1 Tax=Haloferula sp. BvORR071 TaxID=1396141 RepID=UPI00054D511F|nr:hypothetical protein [Haloferula sp. BvORR071]
MSNVVQPGDVPKVKPKPPALPAAFLKHLHLLSLQLGGRYLEDPPRPMVSRAGPRWDLRVYLPLPPCEVVVMNLREGIARHLKVFQVELGILILTLGIVGSVLWSLVRDGSSAQPATLKHWKEPSQHSPAPAVGQQLGRSAADREPGELPFAGASP